MKVKPVWFWRLLRVAPSCAAAAGSRSLHLLSGITTTDVPYDALRTINFERGLLGETLKVEWGEGQNVRLPWLAPGAGAKFVEHVERLRQIDAVRRELHVAADEADRLLKRDRYLNHRSVQRWQSQYAHLETVLRFPLDDLGLESSTRDALTLCRRFADDGHEMAEARNGQWLQQELATMGPWFDQAESNPLTQRQREAIAADEDHCLVVAGAGTGKTSTVVAKVGYLIEKQHARADEILVLAFARKAKEELHERIEERFGVAPEVRTFHSLGVQILAEAEGRQPTLAKVAEDEAVLDRALEGYIDELLEQPAAREHIASFFAYYLAPARTPSDFETIDEHWQYLKSHDIRTLRGERVRSYEECIDLPHAWWARRVDGLSVHAGLERFGAQVAQG